MLTVHISDTTRSVETIEEALAAIAENIGCRADELTVAEMIGQQMIYRGDDYGNAVARIEGGGRWVGADGCTLCGDWLRLGARRLCGGCANGWEAGTPEPSGCGEVLERNDHFEYR